MGVNIGGVTPSKGNYDAGGAKQSAAEDAMDSLNGIVDEMAKTASVKKKDNIGAKEATLHDGIQERQEFLQQAQKQAQQAQEAQKAGDFAKSQAQTAKTTEQEAASLLAGLLADEDDIKTKKKGRKKFSENLERIGLLKADLETVKLENPEEQEVLSSFLQNFERIKNAFSRLKRADSTLKRQEAELKKRQEKDSNGPAAAA